METAIKFNFNLSLHSTSTLSKIDDKVISNFILTTPVLEKTKAIGDVQEKFIKKSIDGNNTPGHITVSDVIEYNKQISYIERKVIDMDMQIQSEINKLIRLYKNIHIVLFIISLVAIALSWLPFILPKDVSIVLKPLSVAFSLMIIFNYYLRRVK